MTIKELLSKLNLNVTVNENAPKDVLTIDLKNSDEYARVYTRLENTELLELDEASVTMSEHSTILEYYNEEFNVTLESDFDSDVYKLVIERIK